MRKGLPNRVDRSVMSSLSGSSQLQLLAALRYLELVSPKGIPTERLSGLVESDGAKFRKALREVLTSSYPFLFNGFDLQRATVEELTRELGTAGASGDNVRKCVSFFLAAAKQAELPVSPFALSGSRVRRRSYLGSRTSRDSNSLVDEQAPLPNWQELALSKLPEFDPAWSAQTKSKWLEAFNQLIKSMDSAGKA
jgi:hypothetical protein